MKLDLDFERDFWIHYPRKVAKAHARKMWNRLNPEEQFAASQAVPLHARYWNLAGRTADKIPHAGSWLNPEEGRRWEDELEMPEEKNSADWMKTTSGIAAKAKELGIQPKAGEDWHSLKTRIFGAMKAA